MKAVTQYSGVPTSGQILGPVGDSRNGSCRPPEPVRWRGSYSLSRLGEPAARTVWEGQPVLGLTSSTVIEPPGSCHLTGVPSLPPATAPGDSRPLWPTGRTSRCAGQAGPTSQGFGSGVSYLQASGLKTLGGQTLFPNPGCIVSGGTATHKTSLSWGLDSLPRAKFVARHLPSGPGGPWAREGLQRSPGRGLQGGTVCREPGTFQTAAVLDSLHARGNRRQWLLALVFAGRFLKADDVNLSLRGEQLMVFFLMIKMYVSEQKLEFLKTCICH